MITMIILLWIAATLNAPTWLLVIGYVSIFLKLIASFIKFCMEVYEKWQDK